MDKKEFFLTVVAMRAAQKAYIETESEKWLEDVLRLEGIIDTEIERVIQRYREKGEELITDKK